jgi:hypothetical protein
MTDPLPEIKKKHDRWPSQVKDHDIDWLIGEVEQLRAKVAEWKQAAGAEADLADERGREVERLRGELRLARSIIHELAWGPVSITDKPRLRAALKAWSEADKVDLLPEGEQP